MNEIPTEIEAPPFGEQARAAAFLARLKALGLPDAYVDAEGNVVGLRRGRPTATGHEVPRLVVTAHLDTVFPAGTDVRVKARGDRLYAPGISDDARGLAVLLSWLKVLEDRRLRTVGDLLFVVANLARKLDVEPEDALRAANAKFVRRFGFIEAELARDERTPEQSTLGPVSAERAREVLEQLVDLYDRALGAPLPLPLPRLPPLRESMKF